MSNDPKVKVGGEPLVASDGDGRLQAGILQFLREKDNSGIGRHRDAIMLHLARNNFFTEEEMAQGRHLAAGIERLARMTKAGLLKRMDKHQAVYLASLENAQPANEPMAEALEEHLNDNLHGSGFDNGWKVYTHFYKGNSVLLVEGSYHPMDQHGSYVAWVNFNAMIDPRFPLEWKLSFSRRMRGSVYGMLPDYIDEVLSDTLRKFDFTMVRSSSDEEPQ